MKVEYTAVPNLVGGDPVPARLVTGRDFDQGLHADIDVWPHLWAV